MDRFRGDRFEIRLSCLMNFERSTINLDKVNKVPIVHEACRGQFHFEHI